MRRIVAPLLLALACGLVAAGCGGERPEGAGAGTAANGDAGAEALIGQLNSFTEELLAKVDSAPDTKAGVAEAQRMLDARAAEMAARIAAHKREGRPQQRDAASRGRWLEAEVDNTDRVHRLQVKYSDAAARDPGLKAALAKLVADYDGMFVRR